MRNKSRPTFAAYAELRCTDAARSTTQRCRPRSTSERMRSEMRLLVGSSPSYLAPRVGLDNYRQHFGMLCQPRDGKLPKECAEYGVQWAMDNYAFVNFNARDFCNFLEKCRPHRESCLWVAAPDVVRNAEATMRKFPVWNEIIRSYGYPVALVAQNGIERMTIPWDDFDALFIGGSDDWRKTEVISFLIREAQRKGKLVHVGRVNSNKRLNHVAALGADTADGSSYAAFQHKTLKALPALKSNTLPLWENLLCS